MIKRNRDATALCRIALLALVGISAPFLAPAALAGEADEVDADASAAGGPFLPRAVTRSGLRLTPKVTLALQHRSYRILEAGPLRYPEGSLDFRFRASPPEGARPVLASLGTATHGVTYSAPTLLIEPPSKEGSLLSYEPRTGRASGALTEILFAPEASLVDGDAAATLGALAERVMRSGSRIQIYAFAGAIQDRSSTARRLALKRGLAVRTYLSGLGIPKSRITVHPVGGVADGGPRDRVDIVIPTG